MNCHSDMDTTTEREILKIDLLLSTIILVNLATFEQRLLIAFTTDYPFLDKILCHRIENFFPYHGAIF